MKELFFWRVPGSQIQGVVSFSSLARDWLHRKRDIWGWGCIISFRVEVELSSGPFFILRQKNINIIALAYYIPLNLSRHPHYPHDLVGFIAVWCCLSFQFQDHPKFGPGSLVHSSRVWFHAVQMVQVMWGVQIRLNVATLAHMAQTTAIGDN